MSFSFWRRYAVITPVSISIAILVNSCNQSKVSQCQRLITMVNQGSSLVEKNKGRQARTTLQLAEDLNKVTKLMADTNFKDTEIRNYQTGFVKSFQNLSQAIAKAGKAMESASTAKLSSTAGVKLDKSKKEIEKSFKSATAAAKLADKLIIEINNYCNQQEIVTSQKSIVNSQ